jgi:hypothetical protein
MERKRLIGSWHGIRNMENTVQAVLKSLQGAVAGADLSQNSLIGPALKAFRIISQAWHRSLKPEIYRQGHGVCPDIEEDRSHFQILE